MSKDEFNKRLTHKYSTPEKRRELYRKMVALILIKPLGNGIIERYDKMSETEQWNNIQYFFNFFIKKVFFTHSRGWGVMTHALTMAVLMGGFGAFSKRFIVNQENSNEDGTTTNSSKTAAVEQYNIPGIVGAISGLGIGTIVGVRTRDQFIRKLSTFMKDSGLDKL